MNRRIACKTFHRNVDASEPRDTTLDRAAAHFYKGIRAKRRALWREAVLIVRNHAW